MGGVRFGLDLLGVGKFDEAASAFSRFLGRKTTSKNKASGSLARSKNRLRF